MTAAKNTWPALLFLVSMVAVLPPSGSSGTFYRVTAMLPVRKSIHQLHQVRGGAIAIGSDTEYDDDEYGSEYGKDENEAISTNAKELVTSTKAAVQKKKTATIKSKVKVAMAASSLQSKSVAKKTSGGSIYKRYVPYIVRACVNPFTLFAMTKAYFLSLCDINFPKEDNSQTLRSALQEKARKQNQFSSGSTKPSRKMKPGQAKTLSDLPQLSA